jgi:pilus assembly protein CpaF
VVIQVARLSDGSRKIMSIQEIAGMEGDVITMQEIFAFERQGMDEDEKVLGRFRATGIRPRFTDRLRAYGIDLPQLLFTNTDPSNGRAPAWERR